MAGKKRSEPEVQICHWIDNGTSNTTTTEEEQAPSAYRAQNGRTYVQIAKWKEYRGLGYVRIGVILPHEAIPAYVTELMKIYMAGEIKEKTFAELLGEVS